MYKVDQEAIEQYGMTSELLMENAGRAIVEQLLTKLTPDMKTLVLVGSGNNGGDGFVIGRYLYNLGFDVRVVQVVPDQKIKGAAAIHKSILNQFGCPIIRFNGEKSIKASIEHADIIVDALLGIGYRGSLSEPFYSLIKAVNQSSAKTIAIDLPSGVPAESDPYFSTAIQADLTYCIEAPKPSAFIEHYASYYGDWHTVHIGLPVTLIQKYSKDVWTREKANLTVLRRDKHSHKGNHGKGIAVGGSKEMPGAITLTAKSALRAGLGLLTVVTFDEVKQTVANHVPEVIYHLLAADLTDEWLANYQLIINNVHAVVIGMGMGRLALAERLVRTTLSVKQPLIIDGDGLYHIKDKLELIAERDHPTILTPHPGEMARLVDKTIDQVKSNPFHTAEQFARQYNVFVVLKGAYTIITDPEGNQTINTTGNAGLAKAGSGDCLAGIILAQLCQKQPIQQALANACFIHGLAADLAVKHSHSNIDLLATDVIENLSEAFRTCLN